MTWNDICEKSEVKMLGQGFLYVAFTDFLLCLKWPLKGQDIEKIKQEVQNIDLCETRLLECRIFNEKFEYRLARSDLGHKFQERFIDDRKEKYQDYFDETQYFDIDNTKSEKKENCCAITATGGGHYELPIDYFENAKICIRNYIGYYEETGQAYILDWRLVGFLEQGGKRDGTILS